MMWCKKSSIIILLILIVFPIINVSAGSKVDLEKGIEFFNTKKFDEAKKVFTDIVKKNSKNSEACYYLGRIYYNGNDFINAITWFEKAIAINDNLSTYHQWLGSAYGNEINNAANIKKPYMAIKIKKEFEKALELNADNNQARFGLMKYYLEAPFFVGGSKKKANKQAAEIKKRDPQMGHEAYISIYNAEEKFDLVEKEYFALIKTDPKNFEYHNKHVWFYINNKDYEKAYKKLVRMIQDYPENDWPYYSIGYIGFVSGAHLNHAEKCMQKLFEIISSGSGNPPKPRLAWFHFILGTIYKKNEKKDRAKNEYEIALVLNPYLKEAREALNEM